MYVCICNILVAEGLFFGVYIIDCITLHYITSNCFSLRLMKETYYIGAKFRFACSTIAVLYHPSLNSLISARGSVTRL